MVLYSFLLNLLAIINKVKERTNLAGLPGLPLVWKRKKIAQNFKFCQNFLFDWHFSIIYGTGVPLSNDPVPYITADYDPYAVEKVIEFHKMIRRKKWGKQATPTAPANGEDPKTLKDAPKEPKE